MKKFFEIHDYSENMKDGVASYNIKVKADIWWEGLKNVRSISKKELIGESLISSPERNTCLSDTTITRKKSFMNSKWVS